MNSILTKWIDAELPYTGEELRSHFLYERFGLLGDAALAFVGPCRVPLEKMVDLEDVKAKKPIFSEKMLHFLLEFFECDLTKTVFLQRLLISAFFEELTRRVGAHGGAPLCRRGDDLYDGDAKLSVSIATVSPVSTLIHAGINVSSRNTPVLTKGLEDYGTNPKDFAEAVLKTFSFEIESARRAAAKVRAVK